MARVLEICLILIVWALLGCVEDALCQRTINLLHFGWLTTSGEYQYLSNPDVGSSTWVVAMAIKHFNDRYGGVLPILGTLQSCDAQIRLIGGGIRDDRGLSSIAMRDFIGYRSTQRIDIIHGGIRSDVSIPLAVTAGTLQVPQISHFSTSETLSDKELYPKFFRTVPSDAQRAQALAILFQSWRYRKVGMIYVNEAFGLGWRTGLARECLARGIRLVAVSYESTARGAVLDDQVRVGLRNLIDERINVIMHTSLIMDFVYSLSRVSTELNWVKGKLYIGHSNYFQRIVSLGSESDRVLQAMNGSLLILPLVKENHKWASLRNHWRQINITDVEPLYPNTFMKGGGRFNLPVDYFTRGQERERYNSWAYAYDSVAAIGLAMCSSSTRPLADSLKQVDFEGVSGRVRFDGSQNRDASTADFTLVNLVMQEKTLIVESREVGETQTGGNWTFNRNIMFSDGSSQHPYDIDPPTHVIDELPVGLRALGWIEATVAMILGLGASAYLKYHERDKIIIESQPIFMMLLSCGCVLMGASIVPLTVDTSAACMLFPWLFALGFTLITAALAAKSVRVAILWYHRGPIRVRRKAARARTLLVGVAMVLAVEVCILIAWQVVAPLQYVLTTSQRDSDGNPLYSSGTCAALTQASTIFFAVLVVFVCVVVFATMWISFWVRNAPEKYHETKMSAIAAISIFQVFFVGVPSAVVVWSMPVPRFLVLSSITFLICIVVLGTMFFPKVFKAYLSSMQSSSEKDHLGDSNVAGPSRTNEGAGGGQAAGEVRAAAAEVVRSHVKAVRSAADYENLPGHEYVAQPIPEVPNQGVLRNGLFRRKSGPQRSGESGATNKSAGVTLSDRTDYVRNTNIQQQSTNIEPSSPENETAQVKQEVATSSASQTSSSGGQARHPTPTAAATHPTNHNRNDPRASASVASNHDSYVENGQDASSSSWNRKGAMPFSNTTTDSRTCSSKAETHEEEEEYRPSRAGKSIQILEEEKLTRPSKTLQLT